MIRKLLRQLIASRMQLAGRDASINIRPGNNLIDNGPEELLHKGLLQLQNFDLTEAIDIFSKMTRAYPLDHRGFVNLGSAYLRLGSLKLSRQTLEHARKLAPASPEAAINYALTLRALALSVTAINILNNFIRDHGPNIDICCVLSNLIGETHGANAALLYLTELSTSHAPDARFCVTFSDHLMTEGRRDEAESWLIKAILLDTNIASAHVSLGRLQRQRGNLVGAEECFNNALRVSPLNAEAQFNQSLIHLTYKRYDIGWDGYEKRLLTSEKPLLAPNIPLWKARDNPPQHLLVITEQGLGDEIMFASCFSALSQEIERITFACDHRLANLFRRSFPAIDVVAVDRQHPDLSFLDSLSTITRQIPIGSLPHRYRSTSEAFSQSTPYLRPNPQVRADWCEQLKAQSDKPIIGFAWRGGINQTGRQSRTLPLQHMLSSWNRIAAHFVVLQYDIMSDEIAILNTSGLPSLSCFPEALKNLNDTAALIDVCDLIISVPTTVIHLAGAMAKPTWILVPSEADWRYGIEEESIDWYSSVRLFRRKVNSSWDELLATIANELMDFLMRCNNALPLLRK